MSLSFEIGSAGSPKGHTLLYFQDGSNSGSWLVTYVVVLPVKVDLSRYLPPMFLSQVQMGNLDVQDMSAFAFPPVPEPFDSKSRMEQLAALRGDDLLYGGALSGEDLQHSMLVVNELVQEYAQLCLQYQAAAPGPADEPPQVGELSVSRFMYEFMSPVERLAELSKLMGKLQFAVAGPDEHMVKETKGELEAIASHFAEHFWMNRLLEAAGSSSSEGRQLAQLYLDRCYRLVDEDFLKAKAIEEEIGKITS
ncbi:MAG: hypothetical protein C1O27_001385 [Chloroflexi bacterium]|jgi:hypothetical protein|nr:MAG: hypothetical protein C1O27_001385 [Chloroflexota bacterium]